MVERGLGASSNSRLVSALARATERVESLEGEKATLEDQIRLLTTPTPLVLPPQQVLNLTTATRHTTAMTKGTLITFDDTFTVLKVYANCVLSTECMSHTEAVGARLRYADVPEDCVFHCKRV